MFLFFNPFSVQNVQISSQSQPECSYERISYKRKKRAELLSQI